MTRRLPATRAVSGWLLRVIAGTCRSRLTLTRERTVGMDAGRRTDLPRTRGSHESGFMEPTRLNANRYASLAGGRMSLDEGD
jgi:hypothetical protein